MSKGTPASLYVSDLDGTLLQNDATLSSYARETLTQLLGDGLPFTVASARSGETMREILGDLPLRLPIIEFNGGVLSDLATGERVAIHDINTEAKGRLFEMMLGNGYRPFLSTFDGARDRLYYDETTNDGAEWYLRDRMTAGDPRLTQADRLEKGLQEQVVCMTLIDTEARIRELDGLIGDGHSDGVSVQYFMARYEVGWWWMTIQSDRATKDQAVRRLMDQVGCDAEQVTAFGDEINDVGMLKTAGRGVAVEGAVPEVLEVADRVIGSNEDDSVVRFLEEEWV